MNVCPDNLGSVSTSEIHDGQAPSLRCEVITTFQRLMHLSPQWEELWQSDPRAEIFQTPAWHKAWWNAFGIDCELCSIAVFAGDELKGILPLVRRGVVLQFAGVPQADYADIICDDARAADVLAEAFKALLKEVAGWRECAFGHLSKHSRLIRHYQQLPWELRSRLQCLSAEQQHTIILRNQRESIFDQLLGKQHTKRLQKKLQKAGQLRFRRLETPTDIDQNLSQFFQHHIRRHAAVGRQSICTDTNFCAFLSALVREFVPIGRMRFGVLELDGRGLAWDLGFEVNGKFLLYQHTFDLDYWHYTPGEVLLWHELQYARDHVSREFDFGKGDELYKDRFSNYSRETFSLFFEPSGLRGSIRLGARSAQAFAQPLLCKIKEVAKSQRFTLRAFRSLRVKLIESANCLRRAPETRSILGCALRLAKKLFGKSVLSERSSEVFALVATQNTSSRPVKTHGSSTEVTVARLGELVDLAWEYPEILSLNDLPECRARLKNGHRVFIVRQDSRIIIGCWLSTAPNDIEKSQDARLGNGTVLVLDQFWSAPEGDLSAAYELLMSVAVNDAALKKADLLVHCRSGQSQLRSELRRLGFSRRFQTVRYGIFSHFRRHSVSEHSEQTVP